ncbi:transposase [Saccharothrix syringae]|uniref:transposase n=1 Tax=Saccharothrix syringae TaxID=103733 RepID=UPI00389A2045
MGRKPGRPPKWSRRQLIDGIRWRVRVGAPWRDVPPDHGPWQTVYGLFRRWQRAGVWRHILTALQARADADGLIVWDVSVDSTIMRAHQHAAGARKRGICGSNRPTPTRAGRSRTITGWGGRGAAGPASCTWPASRAGGLVTAGQRGDSPQFVPVVEQIAVPWHGGGRARGRPDGSWRTRPTAPICATAGSRRPSTSPRPGRPPQGQRLRGWTATHHRQGDLQAAPCRRVRHQPAQAAPGGGHPLRQTRPPLPGHHRHRRHQHLAAPHLKHDLAVLSERTRGDLGCAPALPGPQ